MSCAQTVTSQLYLLIATVLTAALLEPIYSKIRTKTQTLLQEPGK